MKSIGGYLGLEIGPKINTLMDDKYLFNSGRSSCLFYLNQHNIKSIWVPYYCCGDFVNTLRDNGVNINFYHITEKFEILENIGNSASILYVNYFGVKDDYIRTIRKKFKNLIIDNSQALFNNPVESIPTFYSLRKFIGVPDGGMLYANELYHLENIPNSYSHGFSLHLLKQADKDTESGYKDFQLNEKRIIDSPIQKMSKFTNLIIDNVNISRIKEIRLKNYSLLNQALSKFNKLVLNQTSLYTFPLLVDNGHALRECLNDNKVYTPQLWADQLDFVNQGVEMNYIKNIIHLPIDQRYSASEMNYIIEIIKKYYE